MRKDNYLFEITRKNAYYFLYELKKIFSPCVIPESPNKHFIVISI